MNIDTRAAGNRKAGRENKAKEKDRGKKRREMRTKRRARMLVRDEYR